MIAEEESLETSPLLCLRVTTEADPCALGRVLSYFQNLNIVPRRVTAEFATRSVMHIQVDVSDMSEGRLSLICARIRENIPTLNAYWHWL
jgi:hypothetical protein